MYILEQGFCHNLDSGRSFKVGDTFAPKAAKQNPSSLSPRVRQADGLDVVGEPGGLSVLGDDPEEGDVVGDVVHAEPRVQQHLPHLEPLLAALLQPGVPHLGWQLHMGNSVMNVVKH